MSDPFSGLPNYAPLPTHRDHINSDTSSTSNIPISDFRRNEARPIITDDGKVFYSFHSCHVLRCSLAKNLKVNKFFI